MIFQKESWSSYFQEARGLWEEHYRELCQDPARMAMGPDEEWYREMDRRGVLHILTAREDEVPGVLGELRGYCISVIRRHTHYPVLCAFEDSFWLHPSCRKGPTGIKLIREALREYKALGVQRVFFMSIESLPTDRLFEFLGFVQTHKTWSKWIGD